MLKVVVLLSAMLAVESMCLAGCCWERNHRRECAASCRLRLERPLQSLALAEVTILVTATALMSTHMHLQALRRKNSNTGHQNSEVDLRVSRRLLHMHSWQLHMMLTAKRSQTETIITIAEREI